jgi:hypothetical protein
VDEKAKEYLYFHYTQTFVPQMYEQLVKWLER